MADLVDSYSESNKDVNEGIRSGSKTELAQSFDTGANGGNIYSAKFYIKKSGTPTGNVYAILYAHSGTYGTSSVPTGGALATSDALDISSLTTSYQLIELLFSSSYTMANSTKYCISIQYTGGDPASLIAGADGSSPSHGGNAAYYTDSWAAQAGIDVCFYVYKTDASADTDNFFQLF